jgi:DNA-binding response OmpR family regulator
VSSRPGVLIVDANRRNVELLTDFLRGHGFATHGLSTLSELDSLLDGAIRDHVALALIDLTGLDTAVWDRCKRIHEAGIAFITIARSLTTEGERTMRSHSATSGAHATLTKPLRKEQLLALVRILIGNDGDP